MAAPTFTSEQRRIVADEYPTVLDTRELASRLGMTVEQVGNLARSMGIKRRPPTEYWLELHTDGMQLKETFTNSQTRIRKGRDARASLKSKVKKDSDYKIFFVAKSKANSQMNKKELKQELAKMLEAVDARSKTSATAYSKLASMIDSMPEECEGAGYTPVSSHTKSESLCLANLKDDEPCFILRGQDKTAPGAVMEWIKLNTNNPLMPSGKLAEAFDTVMAMRAYHDRKFPD